MERSNLEFPPGPSSIIPGKIIRQFARDPISTLTKIADEYGDISHFKLGRQHVYLINNPDYIEKILIYDHSNLKKGPRLQTAKRIVGEGLVTSEGEFHKKQRKLIQPLFLPKKISSDNSLCATEADLVNFPGSHYVDSVLNWRQPVGITALEFRQRSSGQLITITSLLAILRTATCTTSH
jgi:cytochrome P450